MGKPHPIELRERVVAHVEDGHSHRATAAHFRTSISFVNNMVKLKRETGSLKAKPQGNSGAAGKLTPHMDYIREYMGKKCDKTLDELARHIHEKYGVFAHKSTYSRRLASIGITYKKKLSSH